MILFLLLFLIICLIIYIFKKLKNKKQCRKKKVRFSKNIKVFRY